MARPTMTRNRHNRKPRSHQLIDAYAFLAAETRRAHALISEESARREKEAVQREAFCIPAKLIYECVDALLPGLEPYESEEAYNKLKAVFEAAAWKVYGTFGTANPAYIRSREPLRELAALIDGFPRHHLAGQTLEVVEAALRWCRGVSFRTAPGNGNAPEGVLYPRLSMEMVWLENRRDVPKEWTRPLLPELGAEPEA